MRKEQRLFPRTSFDVLVRCSGGKKAIAKDISLGGICFRSYDNYSSGTPLDIQFTINDTSKIEARGRIVWSRKINPRVYETGLKFLAINSTGRINLSNYINCKLKAEENKDNLPQFLIDVLINYTTKAKAHTRNITHKGMNLFTNEAMAEGNMTILSIPLPAGDEIKAHIKVLWTRELKTDLFENGVEFWNIEQDDINRLMKITLPLPG